MAGIEIVGREAELRSISAFVAGVDPGPRALVLAGEAGIGKTTLWRAALEAAEVDAGAVLACRAIEAEASYSFAGLSELVGPVLDEVLPSLAVPRRRALEVALLLVEPGEVTPDALAVGLAVLDVVRALSERGPVVLAVDDLQWLDVASASVLQIALRRVGDKPVALLATVRQAPGLKVPIDLERCFAGERLSRVAVGPVGLGALRHLLQERLGLDLSRPDLVRVLDATAGNPFFALELGRELQRSGSRSSAGGLLHVPESLRELLGDRLARLPTDTGDVLLQAAASARPTLELVAAAFGDRGRVQAVLDGAAREGIIEDDSSVVRFSHPLYASICYQQAPLWKRRAAHRALASAATDVEERARHLAHAAEGPDATVAASLDVAAELAARRGAPAAGAELCELAAALTPDDPALARRRRIQAATLHRFSGNRLRASEMLEDLLTEVSSGPERADVLLHLAEVRLVDAPAMIALCDEALAAAASDTGRVSRLLAYRSFAHMFAGEVAPALVDARAALDKAEQIGDPVLIAAAIARVGQAETYSAEATEGLLERGAELEDRLDLVLQYYESPNVALARLLMRLGDVDRAHDLLMERNARAVARGDESSRHQLLWSLAIVEWLAGRLAEALDHATEANELAEQTQEANARGMIGRVKGLIEADLGLVEQARASAQLGLATSQAYHDRYFAIASAGVLGRVELALGNIEAAGSYLRDLPGRLISLGINDPGAPVWPDAIETLVALGELEQARAYLDHYEAQTEQLASPLAIAAGARCRGLLASAEGDVAGAAVAFEHAMAALEGRQYPLERGRTLLCMGSVRRRGQQKAAARDALLQALAVFEELGARLWADRARSELERISGRRPSTDELTATEHQVAVLAAQGLANKRIASTLHLGVSTVEAHLSRVYRKLGVGRAELAKRLDRVGDMTAIPRDEATQT